MREAMVYSNKQGAVDLSAASIMSVSPRYASLDELEAAIGANGVLERFEHVDPGRYIRAVFGAAVVGSDGQTLMERPYLVISSGLDGTPGVVLFKLADVTWTGSAVAVAAKVGGRPGHNEVKTVDVEDTGVAEALTGWPLAALPGTPSAWSIRDIGEAVGVARLFAKGTCTSGAAVRHRWR